jgi:diaminopimelate epimerase
MTAKIDYTVWDPMGNITVLVQTPVSDSLRPAVAKQLMETVPGAEQVGFLTQDKDKTEEPSPSHGLKMAGGEFCGNATMSAAAKIADVQGLAVGEEVQITLEVSGADAPVAVQVARRADGAGFECTVSMPLPASVVHFETVIEGSPLSVPLVRLPGIAHFILQENPEDPFSNDEAETLLRQWSTEPDAEAYGLIFIGAAERPIRPLLYVPAADTMVWENACGSGSAAVAAWLASQHGDPVAIRLLQPGGESILARAKITLAAPGEARVTFLSVTGTVSMREIGELCYDKA